MQEIAHLVRKLYKIAGQLHDLCGERSFTPDGHLVGSIGEALALAHYRLKLIPNQVNETHDASTETARPMPVQIKITQIDRVSLSSRPEFLLVLRLKSDGTHEEIYNGPGRDVWREVGKKQKNGQCQISVSRLRELNQNVPARDRIKRRKTIVGTTD